MTFVKRALSCYNQSMQKKLYVTIDLPDPIKESFRKEEKRWKNLNVFWTGFSHVRLTLEYLGVVDKDGLRAVRRALEETAAESRAFDLRLNRLTLGPNAQEPKMFWVTIFEDAPVGRVRRTLQEKLTAEGFEARETVFTPHIVLATANGNQLKGKQTNIQLKGKFRVENLNLYSSQTYAKGLTKYKLLETYPLQP